MLKSILASLLTLTVSQVAAQDGPYYGNQSAPFYLVLKSENTTINGSYLSACHEGAAIEGLCLTPPSTSEYLHFTYNTSSYDPSATSGLLTWLLPAGNLNVSSSMRLSYGPASNVATPVIFPNDIDGTFVNFTAENQLGIKSYQDDTKPLPNYGEETVFRWYACMTYYGYLYHTLAWVMGKGEPQNPTCQKVEVFRIWA